MVGAPLLPNVQWARGPGAAAKGTPPSMVAWVPCFVV